MPSTNEAGPSRVKVVDGKKRKKLVPALPPRPRSENPTKSTKTLQGIRTRRNDTTHPGFNRDTIFVTRKISLGALMGRCRTLLVDEGYSKITLYAMSAAIPHALLLLHACLDLLPFSQSSMRYEIHTGSEECMDEVSEEVPIGAIEEPESRMEKRTKSTIKIDIYVSNKAIPVSKPTSTGLSKRNRPSKRQRNLAKKKVKVDNEEEMMNFTTNKPVHDAVKPATQEIVMSEEEVEEVEEK